MIVQTVRNYGFEVLPYATAIWQAKNYDGGHKWLDEIGTANFQLGSATPSAYIGKENYTSETALVLPGTSGNYASTPDSAVLDITGDITLVAKVALDDWTPGTSNRLVSKWVATSNQHSYSLTIINTTGLVRISVTPDGTAASVVSSDSTVAPTVGDSEDLWVSASLDVDDGSGNRVAKFWTSIDGSSWTQLGSTVTTAGTTSIYSSSSPLEIGSDNVGTLRNLDGKVYQAQVWSGVRDFSGTPSGGTLVFDTDFSSQTPGATSFVENASGLTVTVNASTSGSDTNDPLFLPHSTSLNPFGAGVDYTYFSGVSGNYASTPDAAALDITGDITLVAYIAPDDWTPSASFIPIGKNNAVNQRSYHITVITTGELRLTWSTTGADVLFETSTIATGFTGGTAHWIAATLDVNDGAGNRVTKFWTSNDGSAWTQLGSTITTAGTTSIWAGTEPLTVGGVTSGTTSLWAGKIARAQVWSGIRDLNASTGGTLVADFDPSGGTINSTQTTLTGTGDGLTWTFNRAATGVKLAIVNEDKFLLGTDDYFTMADDSNFDFAASQDFTIAVAFRAYQQSDSSAMILMAKNDAVTGTAGWQLGLQGTGGTAEFNMVVEAGNTRTVCTDATWNNPGTRQTSIGVRSDGATGTLSLYTDGVSVGGAATQPGDTSTSLPVTVGRSLASGVGDYYLNGEITAVAIFRRAVTASEVARVIEELGPL